MRNAAKQDKPGDFETRTGGYTRWDIGADYRWFLARDAELMIFAKWKNIGDRQIRLSTSFLRDVAPEAGESIEVGYVMASEPKQHTRLCALTLSCL